METETNLPAPTVLYLVKDMVEAACYGRIPVCAVCIHSCYECVSLLRFALPLLMSSPVPTVAVRAARQRTESYPQALWPDCLFVLLMG